MIQPFFIRTRATIMSFTTTNWRCSSGLRSSSSIVDQGTYFISILLARLFFRTLRFLRAAGLRPAVFFLVDFLTARLAFAISVHLPLVNSDCVVVQIAVRQLQSLGLGHFTFGNHPGRRGRQSRARRLHSQPVALFRAQSLIVWKRVRPKGNFVGKSLQPLLEHMLELRRIH